MAEISLKRLSSGDFARYGKVFLVQDGQEADISGEGWKCWYPLGKTGTENAMHFGIVKSEPVPPIIHLMERHQDRVEYLIALDRPIMQVVALSHAGNPQRPDAGQADAFVIYPGEIAMVNCGVWHAPALALGPEEVRYLFILGEPGRGNENPDSGLVQLAEDAFLQITVPTQGH